MSFASRITSTILSKLKSGYEKLKGDKAPTEELTEEYNQLEVRSRFNMVSPSDLDAVIEVDNLSDYREELTEITNKDPVKDIVNKAGEQALDRAEELILQTQIEVFQGRPHKPVKDVSKKVPKKKKKPTFPNLINLKRLLNANLPAYVKEEMGIATQPISKKYLRNVTGRFSNSVQLGKLIGDKKRNTIMYSKGSIRYQKDPYQIFNTTPPWATPGRSITRITTTAIRKALVDLTKGKFNIQERY